MGKREIEAFPSHLAVDRDVSAAAQRQAHNAIIFLYDHVLNIPVTETIETPFDQYPTKTVVINT